MSTRPDDESNDKPDGDDAPGASNDDASREERVRGGFHQADSSRPGGPARSRKDENDGASDEPRRRAGRRRTDDEEDEPALGNPFGFDPAALFGRGGRIRPPRVSRGSAGSGSGGSSRPARPDRREREPGRRPGPLAWTLVILFALGAVVVFLSQTWTEVLWFNQLGFSRVIWTQWIASGVLLVVGFLVMFGAVFAAMTTAYRSREIGLPHDEATGSG